MAKVKKQEKSIEQRLEEALVLYEKTPYGLPSNWCWVEFKNLCKVMNGYAFKSSKYVEQGTRVIRITNVQDGYVEDDKPVYYSQKDMEGLESFLLKENDILVSLTGNVGRVATIHRDMLPAALNQRVACLRPTFSMDNRYVYYYLLSDDFRKNCLGSAKGIAQQNMSTETIKEFAFPLAPLEEQKRIVEIIEKQFTKLDEARDLIQKSLDSFADRKSTILHKAFTGELTQKWREMQGVLREKWEYHKFSDLCDIVRGGSPRPAGSPEFYGGDIPFLKVADITRITTPYVEKTEHFIKPAGLKKTRMVKANTLLLTNSGATLGVPAICTFDTTFNDGIAAFLGLEAETLLFYYYFWVLKTPELRAINKGAAQPNLNTEIIGNVELEVPSLDERKEIVRILDSIFEKEDKSKELLDMLDKIDEMKKSILARAFRGELGTSNPTDEPATDL